MIPPTPHPFEGPTVALYDGEHVDVRWPEEWKSKPGWRPYNPSLAWVNGRLFCSVRYSFFAFPGIDTTGQVMVSSNYYGRSETILAELDPTTLQVLDWRTLTYTNWVGSRNSGLEDIRLFTRDNILYGIGVYLPLEDGHPTQGIIRIDPDKWTAELTEVFPNEGPEKNWSPVEGREDFTYSPTGEPYRGHIHGGTQLIGWGDGYLSLVHHSFSRRYKGTGPRRNRGRHYVHHWARWDKDLHITHLTAPFVFTWQSAIEFASGLTRHQNRLLISWGWGDYDLTLTTVNPELIDKQLRPFTDETRFVIRR